MRVIVTRPAAQAQDWLQRLREAGIDACALPLVDVDAPVDPAPLQAAWRGLSQRQLAMFVSPNAVEHFFAARPPGVEWPQGAGAADPAAQPQPVLAAAPGPGTAAALHARGVPPACIVAPPADAASFDSEALWAVIGARDWRGAGVLLVRGDGGRDWLASRLREAGAQVEVLAAYRRKAPSPDAAARALLDEALADPAAHLWWFSSSQAIDHLAALAPPGQDWSRAQALVTHPRIGERARRLGLGRVLEARPLADEVLAVIGRSIESPLR